MSRQTEWAVKAAAQSAMEDILAAPAQVRRSVVLPEAAEQVLAAMVQRMPEDMAEATMMQVEKADPVVVVDTMVVVADTVQPLEDGEVVAAQDIVQRIRVSQTVLRRRTLEESAEPAVREETDR